MVELHREGSAPAACAAGLFLDILKVVCLSVDWIPKLFQKSFQTMEQKLVPPCETKVVADACNASHIVSVVILAIYGWPSSTRSLHPFPTKVSQRGQTDIIHHTDITTYRLIWPWSRFREKEKNCPRIDFKSNLGIFYRKCKWCKCQFGQFYQNNITLLL